MAGSNEGYKRFKPHFLMLLAQLGYTFLYSITEASFDHGMNPHVYIVYRNFLAGVVLLPFAYFLERKVRPKLTVALFGEIFLLSLFGTGLANNMYFASLNYTSTTFISAMINTISSLTFLMAIILRLEMLDIKRPRGVAKVAGTLISLAGVTTMTLYKGATIHNIGYPLIRIPTRGTIHKSWVKGSLLTMASCISWSIWYILQAYTLKRYPAPLSITAWMSFVGAAQTAAYAACAVHRAAAWTVGFNIDLWSIIYGGLVVSGLNCYIMLWCTQNKGPVFVTMFNPLSTLLVALFAYFVLGEKLYVGSIIGGVTVIFGLYSLLWGKDGDQTKVESEASSSAAPNEPKPITEP